MPIFNSNAESKHLGRQIGEFSIELIKVVVISLAIIIPVRYYLIQPFYVKGASMEPNFYDSEYLIVNEISYHFENPARGEIVVFKYPKDPSQFFIKRVIGLPGETIEVKNGNVTVINEEHPDGVLLDESAYLPSGHATSGDIYMHLEDDEYFLLGDNRPSSLDSRIFGPVKNIFIVGKVWVRGWPLDKIGVFRDPLYNSQ